MQVVCLCCSYMKIFHTQVTNTGLVSACHLLTTTGRVTAHTFTRTSHFIATSILHRLVPRCIFVFSSDQRFMSSCSSFSGLLQLMCTCQTWFVSLDAIDKAQTILITIYCNILRTVYVNYNNNIASVNNDLARTVVADVYVTYETSWCSWCLRYWGHVCICCKYLRLIRKPQTEGLALCVLCCPHSWLQDW